MKRTDVQHMFAHLLSGTPDALYLQVRNNQLTPLIANSFVVLLQLWIEHVPQEPGTTGGRNLFYLAVKAAFVRSYNSAGFPHLPIEYARTPHLQPNDELRSANG